MLAHRTVRVPLLAALLVLLAACVNSPISIAETPAQKYAATKLTYDAVLSVAVPVLEDNAVPLEARRALQTAIADSGEIYRSANRAYVDYVAARAELQAGATTSEKLEIATRNLERWLAQLEGTAGRLSSLTR